MNKHWGGWFCLICCGLAMLCGLSLTAQEKVPASFSPEPHARLQEKMINESSGLAASLQYPGVYWTLNDSGDRARIFAIKEDGSSVIPHWVSSYQGVAIEEAANIDWEAIAVDDQGHLYIGAFGNNGNSRRDLAVYRLPEPNPYEVVASRVGERQRFRYPDQKAFPPERRNFDCEAMFWADGALHILTKHRSDLWTKLYRFDDWDPSRVVEPRLLGTFPAGGMVTGADATADGLKLAVLTYAGIWVFERSGPELPFFAGEISMFPVTLGQCESIAWRDSGDSLLVGNEAGELYIFSIEDSFIPMPELPWFSNP